MMMLLIEADSNFISYGQSIFATNINLTDAQDCFIATQFSQFCKQMDDEPQSYCCHRV